MKPKLGTEKNPILLLDFQIFEIKNFMASADAAFLSADLGDRTAIRNAARTQILARYPMLFDHACIAEKAWDYFDYWFYSRFPHRPLIFQSPLHQPVGPAPAISVASE